MSTNAVINTVATKSQDELSAHLSTRAEFLRLVAADPRTRKLYARWQRDSELNPLVVEWAKQLDTSARRLGENVVGFVRAEMNAEFRRQIGKWTREAMVRKAQAGHVTGGRVHGRRQYQRDQESKYLLTGFGRCSICNGGLHVRTRAHGSKRASFHACTGHYNKGPEVCAHVDQWPMEEIDREIVATITGDVLTSDLVEEIITAARQTFEASAQPDRQDELRRKLAVVEREQARVTEVVASGAGQIPMLVERLRTTEAKRRALLADLEQAGQATAALRWQAIEGQMRKGLADWRSILNEGNVARLRQAFRELLTGPIRLTPLSSVGIERFGSKGESV